MCEMPEETPGVEMAEEGGEIEPAAEAVLPCEFTCGVVEEVKTCTRCHKELPLKSFVLYKRAKSGRGAVCTLCNRERNNLRNRALRVAVLTHYSGGTPRCSCCSIDILEFLSLDHINGGGRQHRKTIKIRWWEWLRKHNYPSGFRVLCHNCNQSIGLYGYCPHQRTESVLHQAFESYDENAPNKSYKLTQEQADDIRREIARGVAQNVLALRYRVSRATICLINSGKHWGNYTTV